MTIEISIIDISKTTDYKLLELYFEKIGNGEKKNDNK